MHRDNYRGLFLSEAKRRLEQILDLLPEGDGSAVRLHFHTLRGMGGLMGYSAFTDLAAAAEDADWSEELLKEAVEAMRKQLLEVEAGGSPSLVPGLEQRLRGIAG